MPDSKILLAFGLFLLCVRIGSSSPYYPDYGNNNNNCKNELDEIKTSIKDLENLMTAVGKTADKNFKWEPPRDEKSVKTSRGLVEERQLQNVDHKLPSNLHFGDAIIVKGFIPSDCTIFSINLARTATPSERITVLHVVVRFEQRHIARNTYQNGAWMHEETDGPFPPKQNAYFECTITVLPEKFQIAYNGEHLFDYRHRIPSEWVNSIFFGGANLQVYSIKRIQNIT